MALSKVNIGSRLITSTLIVIQLVAIMASSAAVSKADSFAGRSKSPRRARSAFPGVGDGMGGNLRDYMDRMTRFHPVDPEQIRSHGHGQMRHTPARPRNPKQPSPDDGHTKTERPSSSCPCDEGRMTRIDELIASLLEKTNELTKQTAESRNNIASMMATNRQLRSQMSHVMREKQSLETETHNLQIRTSSLTRNNERLRTENERLVVELLQASATDNGENKGEGAAAEAVGTLGSSLRELNDVVGNREAELIEMGLPVRVGTPQRGPGRPSGAQRLASDSRPDLDAENVASSLLAVNTEIKDMMRKVEQLESRVAEQQREILQDETAGPRFRQVPLPRDSDQVSEKITQLERLVLVALGSQRGDEAGELGIARHTVSRTGGVGGQSRPQPGVTARERRPYVRPGGGDMGPPSAERLAIADTMSEEDLDAMANVVEQVQNKSPRKCAFSVASTGVTLGTDGNPTTIQFDHEFVNKGGDFKMRQNQFVCENAGFYFITFTVRSYDGKYLGVTLMKNDDVQTAIYADSSDRNVMQSQSMVVHLESGDRLWLRIAPSDNFAVHSGPHRYVTFSGFLVYKGS